MMNQEAERLHKLFFVLRSLWYEKTKDTMNSLYCLHRKEEKGLKLYETLLEVDRQLVLAKTSTFRPNFQIPYETSSKHPAEKLAWQALALFRLNEDVTDEAFADVAHEMGLTWEPWMWQQHTNDRGIPNGLKHLSEHSDMSLSGYFRSPSNEVSEAAKAEWRKRYPVMEWGVAPSSFGRPSGIKGWAWSAHCNAWKGQQA